MAWNFHCYFSDRTDGLISKLKLDDDHVKALKTLRNRVRTRTQEVFEEAKKLAKESNSRLSLESITAQVAKTKLKHLSPQDQEEVARLINTMDEDTRRAFLILKPRFWTQGSFKYDTLNKPYAVPPQEMDIDDGTYLPMAIFEDRPVIGHRLLLLLVDSSLKSLVSENVDWQFEAKRTCGRIRIPQLNTHIDVPMYAIPEEKFLQKESALGKAISFDTQDFSEGVRAGYKLDDNCVNLAIREGEQKWVKSDPKIVEDWFNASCQRIGPHLRDICRFIKSWRDAQWKNGGGPSSISLMAATVSVLDRTPHNKHDLGATMKIVATGLPKEFLAGVESPDHTDEKPLFPPENQHGRREKEVLEKLVELKNIIDQAEKSSTKNLALECINKAFGFRVSNCELIVSAQSAPAFALEPTTGSRAEQISSTMASG